MTNGLHLMDRWAVYGKDIAISRTVIKLLLRSCLVNYFPILDVCEKHVALECVLVVGNCAVYTITS
jgi:hypothetical protein